MDDYIRYIKDSLSGNISCSGVQDGYYLVGKVNNNTVMSEFIIPLDVYSSLRNIVSQMFLKNEKAYHIYIWAFKTFEEPTEQKCFKITYEEHLLYSKRFNKHITYEGVLYE